MTWIAWSRVSSSKCCTGLPAASVIPTEAIRSAGAIPFLDARLVRALTWVELGPEAASALLAKGLSRGGAGAGGADGAAGRGTEAWVVLAPDLAKGLLLVGGAGGFGGALGEAGGPEGRAGGAGAAGRGAGEGAGLLGPLGRETPCGGLNFGGVEGPPGASSS